MAVDYDLVVVGNSPEGIYAAINAAFLNARVALVEQPLANSSASEAIYSRTLAHTTRLFQRLRHASEWGIAPDELGFPSMSSVKFWAEEVNFNLAQENSVAVLAALGVDVISDAGEFCRLPQLAFVVKNRRLRSRAYLLATGSRPAIPILSDFQVTNCLTTAALWSKDTLTALPQHLAIVGADLIGTVLAQSLKRLGKEVTLIVDNLLPQEDREAALLIQAQLEAEGVKVLTSRVVQVKQIEDKKWLQAGNQAVEADEIILAVGQQPNIKELNLEGVGVEARQRGLLLNHKLQTTNPSIYACGALAGGYPFSHIAQYEASIALKNALFLPLFTVDYRYLPWSIFTDPPLGRVGMTEAQARRRYKDVLVVRQYFKSIAEAQVKDETTGLCKLVLRPDGEILGAHIVGSEAGEIVGAIATAMRNQVKLGKLIQFNPSFTFSEIISKSAAQWQRDRLYRHKALRNFLESLFIFRRKTFK